MKKILLLSALFSGFALNDGYSATNDINQAFGDMDDNFYETDYFTKKRLQKHQEKKAIKLINKKHRKILANKRAEDQEIMQRMKPLMVEQKNVIKEIGYFFADKAKTATSPDGFRNCLKKFVLWFIKVQETLNDPNKFTSELMLAKCIKETDIYGDGNITKIIFRCGKKIPPIIIKINQENHFVMCGFSKKLNQLNLGFDQLLNMFRAAIYVDPSRFKTFLKDHCGNDLSKLDPANVDTSELEAFNASPDNIDNETW